MRGLPRHENDKHGAKPAMDAISGAKVLLDAAKEIRDIVGQNAPPANLASAEDLLALRDASLTLRQTLANISEVINAEGPITQAGKRRIHEFIERVNLFVTRLNRLNLSIIEIYYPELRIKSEMLYNPDMDILFYIQGRLGPRFNEKIPNIIESFSKFQMNGELISQYSAFTRLVSDDEVKGALAQLRDSLERCEALIAATIRENWDFKELIVLKPKRKRWWQFWK